ncbi:baculoviral IAP repeat-containing protein 3-like [Aphis craccivora]|uniref:Baculoviral IAP repeat-containing protein 3-like n=1 Tax=Aphis craccivora TaxID=307492 RepID=A0A6G0VWP6_APHCR|nr:baculoviral IAP repeat-containing protein 3-like [Aphis craccivora]
MCVYFNMDFESRLKTFNDCWSTVTYITPFDMAQAEHLLVGVVLFVQESMMTIKGHMNTFRDWPVSFLEPRDMAKAGFFYTGDRDKVVCFKCLKEFDRWEKKDPPMGEHMYHKPTFPFVISYKNF